MKFLSTLYLKIASLLFIVFFVPATLKAEIKLPNIFGDHMVLQQLADAAIWGKADGGKIVRVITSWDKKSYSVRAESNGNWKIKVRTPRAGGPFEITISDGSSLKLRDVLIGEVWVCSGQSNMEWPMSGQNNQPVLGANKSIVTSTNKSIRLFTVGRETSLVPLNDLSGLWMNCIPENVSKFSATAYYFGRMLQEVLDVPVGLICSSWGGTRIEPWISEEGIREFDANLLFNSQQNNPLTQQTPTVLFNSMINPIIEFSIRGAIWYQGESNRNEPDEYRRLLPILIDDWRDKWGIGEFPFYFVQIAPYDYGDNGLSSAFLREIQLDVSNEIPNSGMACLLDIGEKTCIHPRNKETTGERLAYLALGKTYGKSGFEFSGPVLKEMNIFGSLVKLTFDHTRNGMTTFGKDLENFKIAGENKRFYPAHAKITKEGISLSSPLVDKPVAVRYAFEDFVVGELYNLEGLPASSFRTDDWEK